MEAVPSEAFLDAMATAQPHAGVAVRQVRGAQKTVGVNFARRRVFCEVLELGFRAPIEAVAMETGEAFSGCDRAGVYILEDWR